MNLLFLVLAAVTVGSSMAAICLKNLVHCALCFATSLLGMAGIFLWLGVQFIGFAQVLVYVGAISILVVFAILLTRGTVEGSERFYGSILVGGACALVLCGILFVSIASSAEESVASPPLPATQVKAILADKNIPRARVGATEAEINALLDDSGVVLIPTLGPTVQQIGEKLMSSHVLALEIIALVLTAALLGAVTIAMPERKRR